MVKFINEIGNSPLHESYEKDLAKIYNYCTFLEQPLKLEMFVPCDENGNVLEQCKEICSCECDKTKDFRNAKDRVLFEGIDLDTAKYHCERNVRTIEYFTSFNVELTPNAIKRIFG